MKCYRIKHLPSGLYFRPSIKVTVTGKTGKRDYVKTNLSKKGKVYATKPSLRWINNSIYSHLFTYEYIQERRRTRYIDGIVIPAPDSDWLIEEV